MKKFFLYIISFILILFVLIGCQSRLDDEVSSEDISKVSLSNSNNMGHINTDFFVVYEDEESLVFFENLIRTATKQQGVVDMSEPDVDLEVVFKEGNKEEYHLWLGKENQTSTLMDIEDTNTIYSVPGEATNQLLDLIN